jgi:hypothetical protein
VTGVVAGNRLHLSFRMRGGMDVDQWLTLAPGGRSAKNVLRVRKFGVTVAALDETIRRSTERPSRAWNRAAPPVIKLS